MLDNVQNINFVGDLRFSRFRVKTNLVHISAAQFNVRYWIRVF